MANYNIKPGPGRPKGLKNKVTRDIQNLVDRVFKANGGEKELIKGFLLSPNEDIRFKMFIRLQEYRYGKPKETIEANVTFTHEIGNRVAAARKVIAERVDTADPPRLEQVN